MKEVQEEVVISKMGDDDERKARIIRNQPCQRCWMREMNESCQSLIRNESKEHKDTIRRPSCTNGVMQNNRKRDDGKEYRETGPAKSP